MSYYSDERANVWREEGDDDYGVPEPSDMTWAVEAYAALFAALWVLCCEIARDLRLLMND